MNLLILESPGKVKKVQSYLGNDWKVVASVGTCTRFAGTGGLALPCLTLPPLIRPRSVAKDVLKRLKGLVAAGFCRLFGYRP